MTEIERQLIRDLVKVCASLAGAIWLLENGGREAAPSDKVFERSLKDYYDSLAKARALLVEVKAHVGDPDAPHD